jgi:hypothetical protein
MIVLFQLAILHLSAKKKTVAKTFLMLICTIVKESSGVLYTDFILLKITLL